ncbi:MAG: ABC transporter permease [Acidobacteriota bacterium]
MTLLAVVSMALGIGATTAIFSVVNGVLLRALPYDAPEKLVMLWESNASRGDTQSPVSPPLMVDWQNETRLFDEVAAYSRSFKITNNEGRPERVRTADITANLFKLLGARPHLGRLLEPGEDGPGRERLAVVSYRLWQSRYGSDPDVVGQSLDLDGTPHEIIGVLPAEFDFPADIDLWRAVGFNPLVIGRNARFLSLVARLAQDVETQQAEQRLGDLARRLEEEHPDSNTGWSARVIPLREQLVGSVRAILLVLLGAVGLVLLIAAVNVANLLLARAASREGEFALRSALGSNSFRLARQLLIEGLLIAALGGVLAFIVVYWGIDSLISLAPADIPRLDEVTVDRQVGFFALATILVTGLALCLAPALRFAWKRNLVKSLRSEAAGVRSGGRLHGLLVVAEVAIATVVLVGAGLLVASFIRLLNVEPGFRTDETLTFALQLPRKSYPEGENVATFYDQTLERIARVPGVRSAAATTFMPLDPDAWKAGFTIEGRVAAPDEELSAQFRAVTSDYFETMGIQLVAGRGFDDRDNANQPGAVIINQALQRKFWQEGEALGAKILPQSRNFGSLGRILLESFEVVGLAADVKNDGLEQDSQPAIYFPIRQFPTRNMSVVVSTDTTPASLVNPIGDAVWDVDSALPLSNVATIDQILQSAIAPQKFSLMLLGLFAGAALLLAAVGIYGVVGYNVGRRRREVGIRMALGSRRSEILWLVLRFSLRLTVIGLGFGLLSALFATRLLTNLLFGVTPTDPIVFGIIIALLLSVGLLAALVPAIRAIRVEPISVLRYE